MLSTEYVCEFMINRQDFIEYIDHECVDPGPFIDPMKENLKTFTMLSPWFIAIGEISWNQVDSRSRFDSSEDFLN